MANLTVQPASKSGTTLNFVAAAGGGDTVHNPGGNARLKVRTSGTPTVVTVHAVRPCDQGVLHDITVNVGATAEVEIALPKYADHQVNGTSITYSSVTGVTVAVAA